MKQIYDEIETSLSKLECVNLKQLDQVRLLRRFDTKYLFDISQLPEFINALAQDYYVLEIDGQRIMPYKTLYFDTPDFELYSKHHRGGLNRCKVRYRSYLVSDINFFEVKFKSNKGKTVKTRIKKEEFNQELDSEDKALLQKYAGIQPDELIPRLIIYFSRITVANKQFTERATIDIGLRYVYNGHSKEFSNIAIAEIKQEKFSLNSRFTKLLKKMHIRSSGFSKYCVGIANMYDDVKINNFKPVLNKINNIT